MVIYDAPSPSLEGLPAAVALCHLEGGSWALREASGRFRALVGGSDPLEALRFDGFEAAATRALEGGEEVPVDVAIDRKGECRSYRLTLSAAGGREPMLWLALTPVSRSGVDPSHFETIVQESPDIIAMIDRDCRHRFVNHAVEEASGLTVADFEGKSHDEMGMPDEMVRYFQSVYHQVFESGEEGRKVFEFPTPDGGMRSYESRVVPLVEPDGSIEYLLSYARDTTDRKAHEAARLELERKMQETQRLESLGLLAGGIAHDFNNLLTSILGMASLTRAQLKGAPAAAQSLEQIETTCMKAADLCGQMLAYAGLGSSVTEAVDLSELLRETRELLGASVSKDIAFELELPADAPAVEADRSQLQQVLMNLLLNGAEAMSGSGTVAVTLREVDGASVDWDDVVLAPSETVGRLCELQVRDGGTGMDSATLARIFEPFFTTKFTGRGLGLSATLGILRQHGGGLSVESEPGKGTTFRLYFVPTDHQRLAARPSSPGATPAEPCRVLLVDDEEDVRLAAKQMLEALGHEVGVAAEGIEALAHYDAAKGAFDVVLLDLTMPGMDGIATLEHFRERDAELPVVLMSGYTEEDVRSRLSDERTTFLPKPFRFERLKEAVGAALRG